MKRILPLITCILGLLSFDASAQWVPITHTNGTQNYGGVGVGVVNNNGTTGGGCGGQFWIQNTGSSYTFNFSPAVDAVWIVVDAINTGESIEISINGPQFPITNCNLVQAPYVNPCSVGNCNIVNGQFVNNTPFWVCGGIMVFYGPITSFTISEPIGGSGTTFDISMVPPGNTIPPTGTGGGSVTAGSNSPVCEGNTLNLTSTGTNGTYSWTGPNNFTSTLQNPSIPGVTLAASGDYIVESTTPCGVVKDTVTVVIDPKPVITSIVNSGPTTCGGTNGTITLNGLAPNQPFTVTYTINSVSTTLNLISNGSGQIIINNNNLTQGTYTIDVVSGTCPPVTAGTTTLSDPPIPAPPTLGSNSPICVNAPVNLTAAPVAGGTFSWSGPSGFTSVQQNPTIPNAVLTTEGNYSATVTVNNCVSPPATIFVDITPLPAPPTTSPLEICQFSPMPPLPVTGSSLLWYQTMTGGTGTPVTPTPSNTTTGVTSYWVTQTVLNCESPRSQLNVTVKPKPIAPFYTGPVHYCRDEPSAPLTLAGTNVQWYDNNQNPIAGAPTVNTSIPGDYTWYADQTHDGCVSDKTMIKIHVADIPPAPLVTDVTQCQFDAKQPLTAVGQALQWYDVPVGGAPYILAPIPNTENAGITTWYVTQTIDGCESPRAAQVVDIKFKPTSTFAASRPLVCENDTLVFSYTGNGTMAETYTWTLPADDSVVLVSGTVNSPNPLVIRFDESGEYPISLTVDNQGCLTSTTYNVKVALIPVVTISVPSDVCVHDTVKVGMASYNQPLATYDWNFGSGVNVFNNVSGGFYRIRWDNAGMFPVKVLVSNTACTGEYIDTVVVHDAPSAQFSITGAGKICIGDSVRLAAADNNGLYSYAWSPERYFNRENNFAPVVNAYIEGEQAITLTVTTPWGCEASHENAINPEKCCVVSLPNVFTPNGDGKNDIFKPITVGTHSVKKFLVVNRWGQRVFETVNEYAGWDGTFKGADQNMDTYYWVLQYKCDGKEQEQKGEVILLR